MNTELIVRNLLLWLAQTTLILALTAALAWLMKSARPTVRLAFWQIAIGICLLLPAIAPWEQQIAVDLPIVHSAAAPASTAATHAAPAFQLPTIWQSLALILAAGILIRFAILILGLIRLNQYRRRAEPFTADPAFAFEADILTSDDVQSPVTFGFIDPVILLPRQFAQLDPHLRETVLYHEILHVRRKDWLYAFSEEILRAVLWFHPAIWYATHEIRLAREEAVDREVVETMNARESYVDALLAIAAAPLGADLAPAPFFLRRKHLKRRIVSIFREVTMSKKKSVSAMLAGCCALAFSCWFVTGALPLKAQPQTITDGPGVTVDTNGATLRHRPSVMYPMELAEKQISGTVTAQLRTDASGNVIDANITGGPDELRKYVLESVLSWHYASDSANATRTVSIAFAAPKTTTQAVFRTMPSPVGSQMPARTIEAININGLSDADRQQLLSQLPVHVGDTWTAETGLKTMQVARAFDEHMRQGMTLNKATGGWTLNLSLPQSLPMAVPTTAAVSSSSNPVRVGGAVMAGSALLKKVDPEYPPLAKAARVQGDVNFEATIGADGKVNNLHLLSGPPLLVQAAMQAVQQWVYKPTLLNGQPVEVITTIDVNFTLTPQ
jgi:TonB family protein